jgi:hypothetical protein
VGGVAAASRTSSESAQNMVLPRESGREQRERERERQIDRERKARESEKGRWRQHRAWG